MSNIDILKKHLQLTKHKRDYLRIINFNIYNILENRIFDNNDDDISIEYLINFISLQSDEKLSGYSDIQYFKTSLLNIYPYSPYEEFIFYVYDQNNTPIVITLERYCLLPLVESLLNQSFVFYRFNVGNEYSSPYILSGSNGLVYLSDEKIILQPDKNNNNNNNVLEIKTNNISNYTIIFNHTKYELKYKTKEKQSVTTSKLTKQSKLIYFENNSIMEHNVYIYRTEYLYRIWHNIYPYSERLKSIVVYNLNDNNNFLNDNNDNNNEFNKITIYAKEYQTIPKTLTIHEKEYKVHILQQYINYFNEDKTIAYIKKNERCYLICFQNFISEKELIKDKIKCVFKPLKRQSIDTFTCQHYPFRSLIPTILFIIIICVLIISTIILIFSFISTVTVITNN